MIGGALGKNSWKTKVPKGLRLDLAIIAFFGPGQTSTLKQLLIRKVKGKPEAQEEPGVGNALDRSINRQDAMNGSHRHKLHRCQNASPLNR